MPRFARISYLQIMPDVRIGISGWRYGPWRGTFYPKGLPQRRELEYASCRLNSIEINGSFYSLQRPEYFRQWYDETPADFVFSVKGGRFITHMKKLKDVDEALANFLASGVLALEDKLGPILWQFPPGFALNMDRFEAFFGQLPRDTQSAARIAKGHGPKLKGRVYTKTRENRRMRHAIEVRHPSFLVPGFIKLLRRHNIAFVFADTAGTWPYTEDVTADFVYARLHGDQQIYVSGYTDRALDGWAARMRAWSCGCEPGDARRTLEQPCRRAKCRDVYAYFDNDVKVRAPFDAMNLARKLGVKWHEMGEDGNGETPEFEQLAGATARTRWPGYQRRHVHARRRRMSARGASTAAK
jgi:uncharacterized protein YecE (DUF72 family)